MLNIIEIFPLRLNGVVLFEHKIGFAILNVFSEHQVDKSVYNDTVNAKVFIVGKYGYKPEIEPFRLRNDFKKSY